MELRDYLNVIRARRGVIILATAIVASVALVVSLIQPSIYEAEAKVLISEKDTGAALLGTVIPELSSQPERALQTQVQLVEVRPVAEASIKQLNLEMTADDLLADVTVASVGQTNIVSIKAQADSPEQAAEIANSMAEQYVEASRARKRASIKEAADEVEQRLEQARAEILALGRRLQASGRSDELAAELQIATGTYTTLAEQLEQLRINERLESGSGTVVQPAVVNTDPVEPQPLRNTALGLLVGLVFGVGMAFLYDYLDSTIKSTEEAEKVYGAPVLGIVPLERMEKGQKRRLTIVESPGSSAAEAYRVLRNSIDFVNFEHDLKTLLVTSGTPSEGKSTVSANLAASLAQAGKKVVLLSCDFRRPTTHQFFDVNNMIGLSDVLIGTHTLKSALQQPGDERLLVLTAGKMPPNPSELLSSSKMKDVLDSLSEWADWVIIDTPPILAVADPVSVARWVDGVLLVSKAGESTREAAEKTVELLGKVGARIVGVAVWGLDESKAKPGYGYGYGYYTGGYYYQNSYYGYGVGAKPKAGGSSADAASAPELEWVQPTTPARQFAKFLGRVLTFVLGFLVVAAVALTIAYFMDQYFGWGVYEVVQPWIPF